VAPKERAITLEETELAKDFQLIHITVDEERFNKANNRLRNQFAGCMHAHNELTI
jgi:hypothetical protein